MLASITRSVSTTSPSEPSNSATPESDSSNTFSSPQNLSENTATVTMTDSKRDVGAELTAILKEVKDRDPDQLEFFQAVEEVAISLRPLFEKRPHYLDVLRVMVEPERIITFRVPWFDDNNQLQTNRGYRVQFNSALGPYKGGLRFYGGLKLSVIKFLGFEQILKNALTGLPMGGGKGGTDFNPKGKSDTEVMRFCQSFMTELSRHIGADTDVPAGDIGVGGREIGFLTGQYKRIRNNHQGGMLTGKGLEWGGSNIRPEATGYGLVYLSQHVLKHAGKDLKGKSCLVSGSGNVAQYCSEKLMELGAKVVTLSDSGGYIYEPEGITAEGLKFVMNLKNVKRGRISEYTKFSSTAKYVAGERPWGEKADYAFPCATQNEIDEKNADQLIANGIQLVAEGANMPSTSPAIEKFQKNNVIYAPAKAANAGGVATSGLEMSQNSLRLRWDRKEVDERLQGIMKGIFDSMVGAAKELGSDNDFQLGANAAGFIRVADAMIAQGMVVPKK
jgi:glutamate dehydrogenase (NADP+)